MELEKLRSIVADVLHIDVNEITEDTVFVEDLGADSLDLFQIIMEVEEVFDIEFDMEATERMVSVGEAAEEIRKAVG